MKIESFHSGERFLPMRNMSFVRESMRSYVLLATRRVYWWWGAQTASLSTSSVWRWRLSWVCVISGELDNWDTLSSHSSDSSQALTKFTSSDWFGRWQTMKDSCSFSHLLKVSHGSSRKLFVQFFNTTRFHVLAHIRWVCVWVTYFHSSFRPEGGNWRGCPQLTESLRTSWAPLNGQIFIGHVTHKALWPCDARLTDNLYPPILTLTNMLKLLLEFFKFFSNTVYI